MRSPYIGPERRRHPRISAPVPVHVRLGPAKESLLEFDVFTENLSAGGLSAFSPAPLMVGDKLYMIVDLMNQGCNDSHPRFSAYAVVRRIRDRADGRCEFGASFTHYRFV